MRIISLEAAEPGNEAMFRAVARPRTAAESGTTIGSSACIRNAWFSLCQEKKVLRKMTGKQCQCSPDDSETSEGTCVSNQVF
jgi:hypothetical protein